MVVVWSCGRIRGSRRDASRAHFFCCPAAPAVAVTAAAAGVGGVGMVWWCSGGVVVIPGPKRRCNRRLGPVVRKPIKISIQYVKNNEY